MNNACLVPKLAYLLQTTKLSQARIGKIHQPVVRLIKNKIGLSATTGNYILIYQDLGRCRLLGHEVLSQQVVSLQNRLNSVDQVSELMRLRVRQEYALADLVTEQWEDSKNRSLQKIWKNNLACQILVKAKK